MTPTRWTTPVAVVLVAGVLGVALAGPLESFGLPLTRLPWTAVAAVLLLAVAVLALGWPVRRWNRGHRDRPLDPLRAARTAVLGQASALAGAALLGWYLGQVAYLLPDVAYPLPRQSAVSLLVAAGASAVLLVAGLLVERWCRLPDDDDEPPTGAAGLRSR
ncbi:DUF3180 domain-containing protein [Pseudokineococcus basanitobsidens]|uniref:DUF3180 domain-containing protein n=1 Tax=Pseudokineococcus basanitobsidens TaxID=1926649 RepID=A0ABU8RGE3_9ACTN